ncbi:MAG: SGNH/GDSL hydrolase family protein [candidate division Zixibacteria bacterium]|nr:SGNH/GDSL hydrolase family protein [candidate division Zixibacteria bacterium]
MTKRSSNIVLRLVVAVVSLVTLVALIDGVIRLAKIETFFQNRFFILNRALDYPDIFKKDHNLFWRFRPDRTVSSKFFIGRTYRINSLGLHGPEIEKHANRPRILGLGNSCTFGWGVAYETGYLRQLETMLTGEYEVINGAIPGYTSLQGKRFYESDLRSLGPDIVLILFAFNDHWAAASQIADKDQQPPPQFLLDIQNNLSRLHTYRLMKKLLLVMIEQDRDSLFDRSAPVYRVGPDDFRDNIESLCQRIRDDGARPILLTSPIPLLATYYPPGHRSPLHSFHEKYNRIIREIASISNIKMVDLAVEFDRHTGLFDDPLVDAIHFNARGHHVAARIIHEHLTSVGRNVEIKEKLD